jgi:hypothetical protein
MLKERELVTMSPQDFINKPQPKIRFRVLRVQEVLLQRYHEEISKGGPHPGSHGHGLNLKIMEG